MTSDDPKTASAAAVEKGARAAAAPTDCPACAAPREEHAGPEPAVTAADVRHRLRTFDYVTVLEHPKDPLELTIYVLFARRAGEARDSLLKMPGVAFAEHSPHTEAIITARVRPAGQ